MTLNNIVKNIYCLDAYYVLSQECFYLYILGLKGNNPNNFSKNVFSFKYLRFMILGCQNLERLTVVILVIFSNTFCFMKGHQSIQYRCKNRIYDTYRFLALQSELFPLCWIIQCQIFKIVIVRACSYLRLIPVLAKKRNNTV